MLCDGLEIEEWEERDKVYDALKDFLKRGEIAHHISQGKRRQKNEPNRYRYNHAWRKAAKGTLRAKILKAIYISNGFAASGIERLSGATRNHTEKVIRKLREAGYLAVVGRRPCASGVENLYHIQDRTKFRTEAM